MDLTVKILISITFLLLIMKSWIGAVAVATATVMTEQSGRVKPEAVKKLNQTGGEVTLRALGISIWMTALLTLMWIF